MASQVDMIRIPDKNLAGPSSTNWQITGSSANDSGTIILVDFLNLARESITNRSDAKFTTIEELVKSIENIADNIRQMGQFDRIYLVTKSFRFNSRTPYKDTLKIILWAFCLAAPEYRNSVSLVLVNGINDRDKEADDRALFILYDEFAKTTTKNILIASYDNFTSIKNHFLRKVTLNFFFPKDIVDNWTESKIVSRHKGSYQQTKDIDNNSYLVVQPGGGRNLLLIK